MTTACYAFGTVLVFCEIGQRATNAFSEINDVIGQFDWYLFPDELKKILPIIIRFAQQPVDIKFFGSISSSRYVFKSVSSTIKFSSRVVEKSSDLAD